MKVIKEPSGTSEQLKVTPTIRRTLRYVGMNNHALQHAVKEEQPLLT